MRKKREKNIDYDLINKIYSFIKKGSTYIEALVEINDENTTLDMYDLADRLPDSIIDELKKEFVENRMVKNDTIQNEIDIRNRIENILEWLE